MSCKMMPGMAVVTAPERKRARLNSVPEAREQKLHKPPHRRPATIAEMSEA